MHDEPKNEHRWLDKLVGEWTFETEAVVGPGEPTIKTTGSETVRSLGGFWIIGEGTGETPGGGTSRTIMTLGYDSRTSRYVGTFIGSMMEHLWLYEGTLDPRADALTLSTEGPGFGPGSGIIPYRDRIEVTPDGRRILTSEVFTDDGTWQRFMTAEYRRKR